MCVEVLIGLGVLAAVSMAGTGGDCYQSSCAAPCQPAYTASYGYSYAQPAYSSYRTYPAADYTYPASYHSYSDYSTYGGYGTSYNSYDGGAEVGARIGGYGVGAKVDGVSSTYHFGGYR